MLEKRERIINGLRTFKEECNRIPDNDCHANCPYEDICLSIRAVGYGGKIHGTPNLWDFNKLKDSAK